MPGPSRNHNPGAGDRAEAELIRDPTRGNLAIAAAAGCVDETVRAARRKLERDGTIPLHACGKPAPRRGLRTPRTTEVIAAGLRTPREVAEAAGVSYAAAWMALRRHQFREITDDAGAAAETLRMARTVPAPRPVFSPYQQKPRPCMPPPPVRANFEPYTLGWERENRAARVLCLSYCGWLAQCRRYALRQPDPQPGVLAGLSQDERAEGLTGPRTLPRRLKPSLSAAQVLNRQGARPPPELS